MRSARKSLQWSDFSPERAEPWSGKNKYCTAHSLSCLLEWKAVLDNEVKEVSSEICNVVRIVSDFN